MKKTDQKDAQRTAKSRRVLPALAAALVLICAALVFFTSRNEANEQQRAEMKDDGPVVIAQGGSLVIPAGEITGEASFFPVSVDGEDMEVIAVRASDGSIRTAFNTCQSCYASGAGFYRFEDGELICGNCGFHFSPDQVEVRAGGCNPWPIFSENKTVTDDQILISYDFLSASRGIFADWKTAVH